MLRFFRCAGCLQRLKRASIKLIHAGGVMAERSKKSTGGAVLRCSRGDQFDRSYIAFESTFTIEDQPRNLASPGTGRGVIL